MILLFSAGQAQAEVAAADGVTGEYMHEITGGASSTLALQSGNTAFGLQAGYSYLVADGIQLTVDNAFSYLSVSSASTYTWRVLVGPTFNFPMTSDFTNAIFVNAGIGMSLADTGSASTTNFTFGINVGKRFNLWDRVAYRPYVGVLKVAGSTSNVNLVPLAFSFAI